METCSYSRAHSRSPARPNPTLALALIPTLAPALALALALTPNQVASEAAVPIAQAVAASDGAPAATLLPRLGIAAAIDAVCALIG